MNELPVFPPAIYRYVRTVFRAANRQASKLMALVPNCPEPAIDMAVIQYLSQYGAPRVVAPGWVVRFDVYYLGGLRHFNRWEIGDIGVLVFAKQRGVILANKVAILQSKRLHPNKGQVTEITREDYNIGFGTLLPGGGPAAPLTAAHSFPFAESSRYRALLVDDQQYVAIRDYEDQRKIPVHYLFYNPWALPVTYTYPVRGTPTLGRMDNGSARVAPAAGLRTVLTLKPKGYSPSFRDLRHVVSNEAQHASGWRLEHFMAELVMRCQQGRVFQSLQDNDIEALFYRRSGPIAAAVSVTVEQGAD
jgi:hypothetical protein